jgi:Protein of unknown function (DUF3667)
VTGELEAAAADSFRDLAGGRHRKMPPQGSRCANCQAELVGPFCHACGQDADTHKRSILRLCYEAFEGLFELDGRLWRTAPALFFRPGGLARDYMEGRLARHIPPFRAFLVALVVFIFAAQHAIHRSTVQQAQEKARETAALATPQGRAAAAAKRRTEAAKDLQEDTKDAAGERADALKDKDEKPEHAQAVYDRTVAKAQTRYAHALQRADRVAQGLPARAPGDDPLNATPNDKAAWWKTGVKKAVANPDAYWAVLFTWGQRVAILLLPIVGLSLALVYRKRREIFIYDHLLVAMNFMSFSFLTNALGLILPFSWMPYWFGFLALWTPVNLFQTLRTAYGSSILGAILKTLIVWSIAAFAFGVLLTGLLVLAVAQL